MFLENICDDIFKKYKENIPDICIIFPSRRAGHYFKNVLSQKIEKPVWSPSVFSIEDFIEQFSTYKFADDFKLLIELYSVYNDVIKNEKLSLDLKNDLYEFEDDDENFDSFYQWGEMLLRDFDIIDKYLADTNILFKNIKDLREIEENFPLELQEDFKRFWGTLFDSEQTNVKENFLKIWQVMGKVYFEFTERLRRKAICYPGMAYRKIYEDLEDIISNLKWKKIIFAGFNSLNPVERQIMKIFANKGLAEIYWDADDYYFSDKNQEAGYFIRKNVKLLNENKIKFENYFSKEKKKINVIGTSSSAGMAKVLGSKLKEQLNNKNFKSEKTAVVLPDAKLLLPVLYSIPDEIKDINITMGYPFGDTPLYDLINLLIELQRDKVYENGVVRFHHSIVQKILLHPYIKFQNTSSIYEIIRYIKEKNIVYIGLDDFKKGFPEILEYILKKIDDVKAASEYLSNIIDIISLRIEKDESKDSDYKKFQLEFIYRFYEYFNRFNEVIRENDVSLNIDTYWKLLKGVLNKIFVPFTGEPLKGLQIMGLLETRALDFENVFILSANEGILPEGRNINSFMPYSLRKALKMPTYEDEDSITSYYFYRLMQKAKNIYIIYDTDIGNNTREKSRYILQIENEMILKYDNIEYSNKIIIPELISPERKNIFVSKTDGILEKLKCIKHFSPTMLNKYISCPLQFYFKYISEIEEEKKVEESFNSRLIGDVIHRILEKIFLPYIGKEINEEIFTEMETTFNHNFAETFENAVRSCKSEYILKRYNGKNYLFKDIVFKFLLRVLENEKIQIPFRIIDIEKELNSNISIYVGEKEINVKINGRIDRIDEKNGIIRIIDYKTGRYDLKKFGEKNQAEYFEKLISNPDFKDNFQSFFYGYFYSRNNLGNKINVCIYPVKKMNNGVDNLKEDFIKNEEFELFEMNLKNLFSEIFNTDIPFRQVDDEKRCSYCPYSGLCYRDLKNTI